MDREVPSIQPGNPLHFPLSSPSFPANKTFKLDEGYSDESKSPSEQDLNPSPTTNPNDAMPLPDWILAQSEHHRAGMFLRLLQVYHMSKTMTM